VFSVNFCVFCGFSSIGVNLCQSVDRGAKGTKDAKKKVFSVFSANFCVFCGFSSIGVNLCKSVDGNAKDAKGNAKAQRKQRRRERKEVNAKGAKDTEDAKKNFFCVLCKFLCFLWFFPQSV